MSQSYEIIEVNSELFQILIIGKTYHGLDEYISELEIELKTRNFTGQVIFDFLLSNGYKSTNRFMCSLFNCSFFNELHNYQIDSRHEVIIRELKQYYFNNEHLFSQGILSKKEIQVITTTHNIV